MLVRVKILFGVVALILLIPLNQAIYAADPYNTKLIATELHSVEDPSPDLASILGALTEMSFGEIDKSLDSMTGQQYALGFIAAEANARQFLKRLYDPLRPLVTTIPNCKPCYDNLCSGVYDIEFNPWIEAGGGGADIMSRRCHAKGLKLSQWQITGGLQATIDALTFGVAGSYVSDKINYDSNGSGRQKTGYGAFYGLYRQCGWYVLADLGFGSAKNTVRRHVDVGASRYNARGKYTINQIIGYIEGGLDFCFGKCLVQPFLGFERNYYNRNRIKETGADPLNLSIHSRMLSPAYSLLGFHLTTDVHWLSSCPCERKVFLSFDCAWTYRLNNNPGTSLKESFHSFGDVFTIHGVNNGRNGIDSALTLTTNLSKQWQVYAEAVGIYWGKTLSYNFLGGVNYSW